MELEIPRDSKFEGNDCEGDAIFHLDTEGVNLEDIEEVEPNCSFIGEAVAMIIFFVRFLESCIFFIFDIDMEDNVTFVANFLQSTH